MFENLTMGAFDPNLEYVSPKIPASVSLFLSGKYVNGVWSQPIPKDAAAYEAEMIGIIRDSIDFWKTYQPGEPPLAVAPEIGSDLMQFKEYYVLKLQEVNRWQTMQASNYFYDSLWGSFENFSKFDSFLSAQAKLVMDEMLDQGNLAIGAETSKITMQKFDFFQKKVVPQAARFTQSDQSFLRDIFVMRMDGEVTLDELVRALTMLSPNLTDQDLGQVAMFAPMLILGPKLGGNTLNSFELTLAKQVNDINSKYSNVRSKVISFLDPKVDSSFNQFMAVMKTGSMNWGQAPIDVISGIMDAIMNGVMSVMPLVKKTGSDSAAQTVKSVISNSVAQEGDSNEEIRYMTSGASVDKSTTDRVSSDDSEYSSEAGSSSKLPLYIGLGLLALLLFRSKE